MGRFKNADSLYVTQLRDAERAIIEHALEISGNNGLAAAEFLGISKQQLYLRMAILELTPLSRRIRSPVVGMDRGGRPPKKPSKFRDNLAALAGTSPPPATPTTNEGNANQEAEGRQHDGRRNGRGRRNSTAGR